MRALASARATFASFLGAAIVIGAPGGLAVAQAKPVGLELVLAIDASGSVNADEFSLQIEGFAAAFRDPDVAAAIVGSGGVAVALTQWSGPGHQIVVLDWRLLTDAASAMALADDIVAAGRQMHGETAIGRALRFAAMMIQKNAFEGRRQVIDVSGDGPTNYGTLPDSYRDQVIAAGITVNGLPILNEFETLDQYYRKHVIGGPGAFLVTARNYEDFARAIRLKLIREIRGPAVSRGPEDPQRRRLTRAIAD